ncbi:hypothetical protein BDV59DRAFT_119937 [Aspergillus ambiguus]|uniref:uncharacterized protein n=1 Tax=Aspergillus ambiguus TaxID=176160 RepID=UPI003CCD6297
MELSSSEASGESNSPAPLNLQPQDEIPVASDIQNDRTIVNNSSQTEFPLNFSPHYVRDWDATAAFRELYQNWKDAIIETYKLDLASFQPVYKEDGRQICVTVPKKQGRSEALGFIQYNKSSQKVTLANSCARIEPEALQFGQTTKRGKAQLAGCHGEGLKLAAMVMSREDYNVCVETNNTHWNFSLTESSQFLCIVSSRQAAIPKRKPNPGREMARFTSRIWRDVTVVIGPGHKHKSSSQGVPLEQFKKWLDVSLEIRGYSYPGSIIETDHGDLIMEPRYYGKIFLKGLLLPSSISEPRPFRLGYNFVQGEVNRDRKRLVNRHQEADIVRKIWESAIQKNEGLILPLYVNIWRNFPRAPDIEFAEELLESTTRLLIWKHLLKIADSRKFYFCQKTGTKSIGVITNILGKEPVGLPDALWNLLRGSVPIRTADEQRIHMFQSATACEYPKTLFGMTIWRALKASLAFCSYPSNIDIVRSDSQIELLVDHARQSVTLNEHVFDIGRTHKFPCRISSFASNGPFVCDHVIEELFTMVHDEMSKLASSVISYERRRFQMRVVKARLRVMPRDIALHAGSGLGTIRVTWEDAETESFTKQYGNTIVYHVVLHGEKCASVINHMLHGDKVTNLLIDRASCGCFQKFTTQNRKWVEFTSLDSCRKYFPMVAVNQRTAFYGHPPSARCYSELQESPRQEITEAQISQINHVAETDYRMQLMMLELQNKRRAIAASMGQQ